MQRQRPDTGVRPDVRALAILFFSPFSLFLLKPATRKDKIALVLIEMVINVRSAAMLVAAAGPGTLAAHKHVHINIIE